jgi:hypothetical protein
MSKGVKSLVAIAFVVVGAFSSAFVLPRLWLWFMVPLGLPALGWAALFGLQTTLSVVRPLAVPKPTEDIDLAHVFGRTVGAVWFAYLLGLIWRACL